jgi:predicted enzyme related to lactoylglutathione lyase
MKKTTGGIMPASVKFAHINLVARDWKLLAGFYIKVFGCKTKPPERNFKGDWLDSLTSIRNAHIRGIHLHLPGCGKSGPTLEIFQYSKKKRQSVPATNKPGFAHIAFSVKNVRRMLSKVERNGGSKVGSVVSAKIEGVSSINLVYARDPEGNIIELLKWR